MPSFGMIDPDTSRKKSRRWLIASEQHVCAVTVGRYRGSRGLRWVGGAMWVAVVAGSRCDGGTWQGVGAPGSPQR